MREQFHWNVQLQGEDGKVYNHPVSTYWDPDADNAEDLVKNAAQAEAFVRGGKKQRFFPVSAERLAQAA